MMEEVNTTLMGEHLLLAPPKVTPLQAAGVRLRLQLIYNSFRFGVLGCGSKFSISVEVLWI